MIRNGQLPGRESLAKLTAFKICAVFVLLLSYPFALLAQEGCNTVTIGSGTSPWEFPLYTDWLNSRTQVIYLAGEIGESGTITSLALDVVSPPGQAIDSLTIRIKQTSAGSYNPAYFDVNGWTVVYEANEPQGTAGWRTFNFSAPFEYNGTSNLLIDFSLSSSTYASPGTCRYSAPGGIRTLYAYSDNIGDPLNWSIGPPAVSSSFAVPNIRLAVCNPLDADLNHDGRVNMLDYAILANQWDSSPGIPSADIAPSPVDGIVDFQDLAVMADEWLNGI